MKYFKNKYKKIFPQIHHIILIIGSLFLFLVLLMIDSKYKHKSSVKFPTNRNLFSIEQKQKIEDICQKANKHLILLYQRDSFFHNNDNSTLKESTSHLLNYIENNKNEDLKNYILSFYAEIILVILDIALIIIWILLCRYEANVNYMKCLLKMICANELLKNICFIISISMYVTIIFLNLVIIYNFSILFQDINNSFCSLFKMSYHTYYGEETFYEIRPKWVGVNEIKNILQKTKNQLSFLAEQKKDINNKINEIKINNYYSPYNTNFITNHINNICDLAKYKVPNPNPLDDEEIEEFLYCFDLLNFAEEEYNEIYFPSVQQLNEICNIFNEINKDLDKIEFSLKNAINKFDSFIKIIKDMEIKYFNNLVHIFENIIHGYLIYIIYIFFIFIFF